MQEKIRKAGGGGVLKKKLESILGSLSLVNGIKVKTKHGDINKPLCFKAIQIWIKKTKSNLKEIIALKKDLETDAATSKLRLKNILWIKNWKEIY